MRNGTQMNGKATDRTESKKLAWSRAALGDDDPDEDLPEERGGALCCCGSRSSGCSPCCAIFWKYVFGRTFKMSVYILDIVTDISVAVSDYRNGELLFAAITLALVFTPGFLFALFAFTQVLYNTTGLLTCIKAPFWILVFPVLPLWPVVRDLHQIYHGTMALFPSNRQRHLDNLNRPSRAYLVKFLEAFTESAPQILLRLYKITIRRMDMPFYGIEPIEYFQVSLSLVTLAANIISTYQKSISTAHIVSGEMDQHERFRLPCLTQIFIFFWWLPFLIARFQSMALFAGALTWWIFVVIGIHVVVVFLFQTVAAGKDRVKRIFIYLFSAFVFIFTYLQFNMKSRMKVTPWFPYAIYVILVFIENSVMLVAWFFHQQNTVVASAALTPEEQESQKVHRVYLIFFHYAVFCVAVIMMILTFCCTPKRPESSKKGEKKKERRNVEMTTTLELSPALTTTQELTPAPGAS
ncbi:XK-related protein 6 [Macrobrachium rosenbergii]|uniref:XK-related protein 6 n=1 Tax=Macrobrachium rosenbergii TaxID=79674 RepID=UPI0034D7B156